MILRCLSIASATSVPHCDSNERLDQSSTSHGPITDAKSSPMRRRTGTRPTRPRGRELGQPRSHGYVRTCGGIDAWVRDALKVRCVREGRQIGVLYVCLYGARRDEHPSRTRYNETCVHKDDWMRCQGNPRARVHVRKTVRIEGFDEVAMHRDASRGRPFATGAVGPNVLDPCVRLLRDVGRV